jgi:hypothetical protein
MEPEENNITIKAEDEDNHDWDADPDLIEINEGRPEMSIYKNIRNSIYKNKP